ncbi:hypothetical protein [Rufibacter roseus]|uniref:Uncharacterized protein n=1 Tax=Rufibacter roseus TaxID=1567108 RepID=A0ABW2DIY7_9BACT|nr:hypothetical protein [Rufibacter roseus]
MKSFLLSFIILILTAISATGQNNPFLALAYDSLVIYDFSSSDGVTEFINIIDKDGKLASTVTKSVKLNKQSAKELSKMLGSKASYGQGTASCFDPHLGIVYYKKGRPVAHVDVCVSCNKLRSNLRIPAMEQGKQGEGKEIYYIRNGLSKAFRKYINALLLKHGFSNQIKEGSAFN